MHGTALLLQISCHRDETVEEKMLLPVKCLSDVVQTHHEVMKI